MRISTLRAATLAATAFALLSCTEAPTQPPAMAVRALPLVAASVTAPSVVISQIYGGGGNSGSTYRNDFIELFNPGTEAVSLAGWSVQYASATGSSWQVTALSGTIQPGGYFLVQQARGSGGTLDLPAPDATGSIAMSGTAGKVALVAATTALSGTCPSGGSIIQVIGFGSTASCPNPTPAPSNTNAVLRLDDGCTFTDVPSADFVSGAPTPRNTASPTKVCAAPSVPVRVEIAPDSTDLVATASVALTATAFDAADAAVVAAFTWSSSDDAIATVSAAGVVTGVSAGRAEIVAATSEGLADTAVVMVTAAPALADVVVSQVYGGGGNSGATLRNDFIELYNRGSEPVDLTGWSVQYASSSGSSWQVTALSGSIQPGRYYLVQQAAGAGGSADLPTPDATGSIAMAAGSGKVLLSSAAVALSGACPTGPGIADRLTYGNNNCAALWGNGAPSPSATLAVLRVNDGCVDTGVAADDFVALAPNPRNAAAAGRDCTEPPREQSDATILINELLGDPAAAENASWGEWFEVRNFGTQPVDLQGWRIISGGTSQPAHTIAQSVVVPAGGYAVLGRGNDPLRNGGLTLDYNYFSGSSATIWLDNVDYLMLVDGEGLRVDSVAWTSLPRGVAKGLRPGLARSPNVDGGDWAFAGTTFGDGDYGTPGAENAGLVETAPFVSPNRVSISGRLSTDPPLPIGFEDQLFASLTDGAGTAIPTTFTWTSLTPTTASIDARGVMRALAPGNATFRAVAADGAARNVTYAMGIPTPGTVSYADPAEFGLPVDDDPSDDLLVTRREFTGSWSASRGIPNWTAANLVGEHVGAGADRCDCFTFDPLLAALGLAPYSTADYTGAGAWWTTKVGSTANIGIDRGHLVRSFDRTAGTADNAATYLFSNIIPQFADNNQGPWSQHEIYLGDLARFEDKELFIFAGASGSLGTLKDEGRVTLPEYTWKVSVVAPRGTRLEDVSDYRDLEVIAVVMPNAAGIRNTQWQSFVVTADSVERLSGYRFLTALPEKTRRALVTGTQPPLGNILPALGTEGVPLTLDGSYSVDPNGSIVAYAWNFGDGSTATGSTATHTYRFAGSYTVQLIVTDDDGLADTVTSAVEVAAVTPAQGIAQLRAGIEALAAGAGLSRGQAQSLAAKVDAAEASIARGNRQAALGQLGALRNELRALVTSGRASAALVEELEFAIERVERAVR